jgi:F-type H+-transporting ATPase subunit a
MQHHYSILFGPVNALLTAILGSPENAPSWWRNGVTIGGFHIAGIAPLEHGSHGAPVGWVPDHVIMAFLVFLVFAIALPILSRKFRGEVPGGAQNVLEVFVDFLRGLIKENIPHTGEKYLPVVGAFFFFITLSNLVGQVFVLQPPTASLNTTFALSLSCLVFFNAAGVKAHGPLGYLKTFAGPSAALAILVFPIEMIGNLARALSLAMRLFGNIYGEHTATNQFVELVPLLVPMPMNALGIFTSFLQAYVFTLLTTVYIGGAIAHEH